MSRRDLFAETSSRNDGVVPDEKTGCAAAGRCVLSCGLCACGCLRAPLRETTKRRARTAPRGPGRGVPPAPVECRLSCVPRAAVPRGVCVTW